MSGEDLRFPHGFFDTAISNCGIGIPDFVKGLKEILRVLRPGSVLVFNDWHLIDVRPHRIFGEVLGKYRTLALSPQLARERSALARMESFHHSPSSKHAGNSSPTRFKSRRLPRIRKRDPRSSAKTLVLDILDSTRGLKSNPQIL
jgi:SAM-dependent methyltransferase